MIIHSTLPDIALPEMAFSDYVFEHVERWGDEPAIVDAATGASLSFADVHRGAKRVAAALAQRGWRKGDVFAIVCPNVPEFALAFHGVAMAGGVVTTMNPAASPAEIASQLRDSGARALLTLPAMLPSVGQAIVGSAISEMFTLGPADGATDFAELTRSDAPDCQVAIDPHADLLVLPYSSGTTGRAKGVMLTHFNAIAALEQVDKLGGASHDDRLLAALPLFHIFGMQLGMNRTLRVGCQCVLMRKFDFEDFLRAIERYRITLVSVVPPIVNGLAKSPLVEEFDLSSLVLISCGAAPLDAALQQAASTRLSTPIRQGYAMTETGCGIALVAKSMARTALQAKPGTCGVMLPNMQARIVDPGTGDDLAANQAGELLVRGPNIMLGYLNNPEATRDMVDPDGWMHTGDIGYFDEDGYLFISDRLKELIKVKGHQVAPAMLEGVLLEHPAVADAAVVGIPDEEAGEVPRAFVVPRPGVAFQSGDIMAFVAARVAYYERLHVVTIIDQIPKSPSGKLLRRLLRGAPEAKRD